MQASSMMAMAVSTMTAIGLLFATNATECGSGWASHCEASTDGTSVDLSGSTTHPGGAGPGAATPGRGPAAPSPRPTQECTTSLCRGSYAVAGLPEVTLADLASFVPDRPTITGDPAGLGVAGMPTNVVAAATEQRLSGTLLGYAVTVRFVPVGFVFDYGDGTTRATTTGGASWSGLGQADFTPTPTSHAYAAVGAYAAHATVEYAASVDFGGGWRAVTGLVRAESAGYDIRVVEVRTALVGRTCLESPRGPGC